MHVDHDELVEIAEEWGKLVAEHGYDVLGDLHDLVPLRPTGSTDPARAAYDQRVDVLTEALAEAVTEVGRLREPRSPETRTAHCQGVDAPRRRLMRQPSGSARRTVSGAFFSRRSPTQPRRNPSA